MIFLHFGSGYIIIFPCQLRNKCVDPRHILETTLHTHTCHSYSYLDNLTPMGNLVVETTAYYIGQGGLIPCPVQKLFLSFLDVCIVYFHHYIPMIFGSTWAERGKCLFHYWLLELPSCDWAVGRYKPACIMPVVVKTNVATLVVCHPYLLGIKYEHIVNILSLDNSD